MLVKIFGSAVSGVEATTALTRVSAQYRGHSQLMEASSLSTVEHTEQIFAALDYNRYKYWVKKIFLQFEDCIIMGKLSLLGSFLPIATFWLHLFTAFTTSRRNQLLLQHQYAHGAVTCFNLPVESPKRISITNHNFPYLRHRWSKFSTLERTDITNTNILASSFFLERDDLLKLCRSKSDTDYIAVNRRYVPNQPLLITEIKSI